MVGCESAFSPRATQAPRRAKVVGPKSRARAPTPSTTAGVPTDVDQREPVQLLFANLKAALPDLDDLLKRTSDHWGYEDPVYRFYHQSYKVYWLQDVTTKIVDRLAALLPGRPLNQWFMQIVREGTEKKFTLESNRKWLEETRPIVEAFFHARYFLEMACRYGRELEAPPNLLPSGWAAILYLYDLR